MKKKLFSTGLIAVLCLTSVFALTACGDKEPYSDYDLSEYVTVGEYKGLEYEKKEVSVSEKEVQIEIEDRLKEHKKKEEVKEGTVADGDVLSIDYEGKMDGKKFDGGSAKGYSLTIGSGTFIDGFEDGLIGKSIGDEVTLNLTFPKDYGKVNGEVADEDKAKMAGKDVVFTVKINSKQIENVPEYNMDFVKEYYSDYDSLEAFEKGVKKDLLEEKQNQADMEMKQALWEKVVAGSKAKKYPETEKKAFIDSEMEKQKKIAESYGMEWADYLETIGYSEEDFEKILETYAENNIFNEMLTYSIAKKEGIEVTDKEFEEYLDKMLEVSGMDDEAFEAAYNMSIEKYAEENNFRFSLLLNKVVDKIVEYGTEKK